MLRAQPGGWVRREVVSFLEYSSELTDKLSAGHTGRGVGTVLIQHLQGWARAEGDVEKIELLVRATNINAVTFYRRLGFVEEGRFRNRVRLPDGQFMDDLAMAWFPNPNPREP